MLTCTCLCALSSYTELKHTCVHVTSVLDPQCTFVRTLYLPQRGCTCVHVYLCLLYLSLCTCVFLGASLCILHLYPELCKQVCILYLPRTLCTYVCTTSVLEFHIQVCAVSVHSYMCVLHLSIALCTVVHAVSIWSLIFICIVNLFIELHVQVSV